MNRQCFLRTAGIEPARISPGDLKPLAITTRPSTRGIVLLLQSHHTLNHRCQSMLRITIYNCNMSLGGVTFTKFFFSDFLRTAGIEPARIAPGDLESPTLNHSVKCASDRKLHEQNI